MPFPILVIPEVYHLGTLDPARRGSRFSSSYEGHCLSVSRTPHAWMRIARLGDAPLNLLSRENAQFLDMHGLTPENREEIAAWAVSVGLASHETLWRSWYVDVETGEWRHFTDADRDDALAEAWGQWDAEGEADLRAILADLRTGDEDERPPEGIGGLVEAFPALVLTAHGRSRAACPGDCGEAFDLCAVMFAEDVLAPGHPDLAGVWWNETYEPEHLSAPRGGILPMRLPEFSVAPVDPGSVDDADLLAQEINQDVLADQVQPTARR